MRGICTLLELLILTIAASGTLPAEQPYSIASDGRLITDIYIDCQCPFSFPINTASSSLLTCEPVCKNLNWDQLQPRNLLLY